MRHIRQHDRDTLKLAIVIKDRNGVRKEKPLPSSLVEHLDRRFVAARLDRLQGLCRASIQSDQPFGALNTDVSIGLEGKQALRRGVGHFDQSVRAENGHRIRQAVDRKLRCLLRADEPGAIGPAELPQLGGHRIKCLSQLAQLIVRFHLNDQVQVPLFDQLRRPA